MSTDMIYRQGPDVLELDKAGNYFCRHMDHMTGEDLHSKADIARELACRDLALDQMKVSLKDGTASDGYHTFNELYEFRKLYNAALFNEWARQGKYYPHKSKRHHDGELCFGGGWFIVVALLPTGQISNHYKLEDWDLFNIPETRSALWPYDDHTAADVIQRLREVL